MIEFDCHAHVYETVTPVDGARYVPGSPAPLRIGWPFRRHRVCAGV